MKNIKEIDKKYAEYPVKILQFGEGNFLRGFVDWMIDKSNENQGMNSQVVIVQAIENGLSEIINKQNGIYHLIMRGNNNGEQQEIVSQIHSIKKAINPYECYEEYEKLILSEELEVVISNTTEAGISYLEGCSIDDLPPKSFPAKVTQLLYRRYKKFNGDKNKGLLFLPVELIDNNGYELKKLVLRYASEWGLEKEFISWVEECNRFTSTLVDRIVTGYPREESDKLEKELGYEDKLIVTSELFNLWVIEGKSEWKKYFNITGEGTNVVWTDDVTPYKKRKVRILNGGHTSMVLAAYLSGHKIVKECMDNPVFYKYLDNLIYKEIIPTIDMDENDLKEFAESVKYRFNNGFVKHKLLDISLNSVSKFKARCLPTIVDYYNAKREIPKNLAFSFAALIRFYKINESGKQFMGIDENNEEYCIKDDNSNLLKFKNAWSNASLDEVVDCIIEDEEMWGMNLKELDGFRDHVIKNLKCIENEGVIKAIEKLGD